MSADFFSIALVVDPAAARRAVDDLAQLETSHRDNVYLDCSPDALEVFGVELDESMFAMSPNLPAFGAIDRFGCERARLAGRAIRHIPNAEIAAWRPQWEAMRDAPGLVDRVFPHLDGGYNDETDVTAAVAAIDQALDEAEARCMDGVRRPSRRARPPSRVWRQWVNEGRSRPPDPPGYRASSSGEVSPPSTRRRESRSRVPACSPERAVSQAPRPSRRHRGSSDRHPRAWAEDDRQE